MDGFAGAVVADEPNAVLVARDVLSAGGNATDAAVALYFTLAVTLPSTAGLGAGGSCIVQDTVTHTVEVVDFPLMAPLHAGFLLGGVPTGPRGMLALHARHGSFQWDSLLAESEQMARTGFSVSRALAMDLAQASDHLSKDSAARKLYFRPNGAVLSEGDHMANYELGAVISTLRHRPGDFYHGPFAIQYAANATALGMTMNIDDMKAVKVEISPGTTVQIGNDMLVLPGQRKDALALMAWMQQQTPENLSLALADTLMVHDPNHPPAPGTVFSVLDAKGGAVSCALTNNGLFGAGRIVPGTGIFLALQKAPKVAAVPALIHNSATGDVKFVGGAGGGADPTAALLAAVLNSNSSYHAISRAVAESSVSTIAGGAARVNALACEPGEIPDGRCESAVAPGGAGYGILVGK